jgi:hypothetical protein
MQIPTFSIRINSIAPFLANVHHSSVMATSVASTRRQPSALSDTPPESLAEKRPAPHRTTISLSPEAFEIAERFKEATGLSMSEAVSELIERTEPRAPRIKYVDGFPTADIPMDGKWITTEDILRAQAELG